MLIGVDQWQQANQNRPLQPVCFRPAAEHYKTLWPEPAIPGKLLHASNERIPFRKDKTEDDRFFVLTLIAIAEELEARQIGKQELYNIQLLVVIAAGTFWRPGKSLPIISREMESWNSCTG